VHEKIQHFMVPVPVKGAWHEEQIDELFASLLGKGFGGEHAMEVDIVQPTSTTKGDVVDIGFGGLRVFG
jgi:protein AATF/BFR2